MKHQELEHEAYCIRRAALVALLALAVGAPISAAYADTDAAANAGKNEASERSVGRYVDDKTIDARIKAAFVKDDEVKARDIHVTTYKGVVQLSGFVETESQASRAAEIALATPGVRSVKNDIQTKSQR